MNAVPQPEAPRVPSRILIVSTLAAALAEFALLTLAGSAQHWLAHPQKTTGLDASQFVEAEFYRPPREAAHLVEEKPVRPSAPKHETALSKVPDKGRKTPPSSAPPPPEENQTQAGPPMVPTHGPVPVFTPKPVIPPYLTSRQLNASVVIDFFITAQGAVMPKLAGSSGNDELDALALQAAKKWQFRPAEKEHKPVDSKVRLRIVFQVE